VITIGGGIYFTHSGTRTGVPSCGSANANEFSFNSASTGGQAMLSGLLTAYSTQKTVTIVGAGTCTAAVNTEDVTYVSVGP
jgi:hypothetical protein